jgi:hypothetical protein
MAQKVDRPLGVTIIAILAIISGILLLFGGISLVITGALINASSVDITPNNDFRSIGSIIGIALLIIGSILLIIGLVYLIVSYGLLKGKGWARTITIIITIISIVIQVISEIIRYMLTASIAHNYPKLAEVIANNNNNSSAIYSLLSSIIAIIVDIVIIYYLYRPNVKEFFRKSSSSLPSK